MNIMEIHTLLKGYKYNKHRKSLLATGLRSTAYGKVVSSPSF
jgi:hypothetical protein